MNHAPTALPISALHALHLYGAAGITAFGWAMCGLVGWDAGPWMPLWFCSALLIYNADRLRSDPADAVNVPARVAAGARLRRVSAAIAFAAALVLVALPLARRDWLTLGLVIAGAFTCLGYSLPLLGWRWKDVPLLKSFMAPTVVAAAIFGLPWLHEGPPAESALLIPTALRAWVFLLFNMLLCDLRDIAGDTRAGVRSVPVALGERRTRGLLWVLLAVVEGLALTALHTASPAHARVWLLLSIGAPLYLGALIVAVRRPRSEGFYEWWVEGMLFLPALAVWTAG